MLDDPQKAALYAWEGAWSDWNRDTTSLAEVRRLVRKACRMYGVPAPAIRGHVGSMWTTYYPTEDYVTFQQGQRNAAIALHEAAHVILFKICKQEADEESDGNFEDHGREFLGLYLYLLNDFGVAPLVALTASAKDAGLRFIPVQGCQPLPFRQRVAKVLA